MDLTTTFLLRTSCAAALAWVWFGGPGFLLARTAGIAPVARILLAPLLGAAVFGTTTCLLFHFVKYNRLALLCTFALCILVLFTIKVPTAAREKSRTAWLLLAMCFPIGAVASADVTPFVLEGGLYVGGAIHDHEKMAIVNGIAREGLPPVSPYYHPGREAPLNYYFLWHFLASQLKVLGGFTGWEADAGLTWFTMSATAAGVVGLTLTLGGRALGAVFACAVLLSGGAKNGLVIVASRAPDHPVVRVIEPYITLRPGLQTLAVNAAWAPQHVFAAAQIVLALFLFTHMATTPSHRRTAALLLGAVGASVFGASLWLAFAFSIALLLNAPVVGYITNRPNGFADTSGALREVAVAAVVAVILSAPIAYSELRGDRSSANGDWFPIAFDVQPLVRGAPWWFDAVGWWLLAVPGVYGVALVLGGCGMVLYRGDDAGALFRTGAAVSAVTFLLVSQCLKSTVGANDLGWRAHLPAYLLFAVFSGVMTSMLVPESRGTPATVRLRTASRIALGAVALLGITLGLCAGPFASVWNTYVAHRPPREDRAHSELRRNLLEQQRAWDLVGGFTRSPRSVVQSNPEGYAEIVSWQMNLPYVLFADRKSAAASEHSVRVFSSQSDAKQRETTIAIVRAAFQGHPDPRLYVALRDLLGIEVLLVDRRDPLFHTPHLDGSPAWRLAHAEETFRIYVAAEVDRHDSIVGGRKSTQ
jgi:hypothetical protein